MLHRSSLRKELYAFSYTYNLAGGLKFISYPSGRTVTYAFDGAGRVNQVSGNLGSFGANYTDTQSLIGRAQGAMASLKLGNSLIETTTYNPRLQETGITAGSLLTLGYGYCSTNNNGNVLSESITDGSTNATFSQGYIYDGVNRLELAAENATPKSFYSDRDRNLLTDHQQQLVPDLRLRRLRKSRSIVDLERSKPRSVDAAGRPGQRSLLAAIQFEQPMDCRWCDVRRLRQSDRCSSESELPPHDVRRGESTGHDNRDC